MRRHCMRTKGEHPHHPDPGHYGDQLQVCTSLVLVATNGKISNQILSDMQVLSTGERITPKYYWKAPPTPDTLQTMGINGNGLL